jgi:hypothetical protein
VPQKPSNFHEVRFFCVDIQQKVAKQGGIGQATKSEELNGQIGHRNWQSP